jgi:hypothetical protein
MLDAVGLQVEWCHIRSNLAETLVCRVIPRTPCQWKMDSGWGPLGPVTLSKHTCVPAQRMNG